MWPLGRRLKQAGFTVAYVSYPSTRLTFEDALTCVQEKIAQFAGDADLVGHSMGGLLAARLLRGDAAPGVRRVVQIGTPNLGTALAGRAAQRRLFRWACGPSLGELSAHDRCVQICPRVGAIGGTFGLIGIDLERPHDGAVPLRSAWHGAGHCADVPVPHTLLPLSVRVAALTAAFLRDGAFPEKPK